MSPRDRNQALLRRASRGTSIGITARIDEGSPDPMATGSIEHAWSLLRGNRDEHAVDALRERFDQRQAAQALDFAVARIDRKDVACKVNPTQVPDDAKADRTRSRRRADDGDRPRPKKRFQRPRRSLRFALRDGHDG